MTSGILPWNARVSQHTKINVTCHINKTKGKTHDHLDAEKAFDKIQHPFIIKTLSKIGLKANRLHVRKSTYEKIIANIILNGGKKSLSSKSRKKA